jgi:hypothetical protein
VTIEAPETSLVQRDNHDRPLQPEAKFYRRNPPSGQDVDRPDIFRLDGREESLLLHVAEEGHESNPYKRAKTDNKEQELLIKEPLGRVLYLLGKLYPCRLHHCLLHVLNPVNTMNIQRNAHIHSCNSAVSFIAPTLIASLYLAMVLRCLIFVCIIT